MKRTLTSVICILLALLAMGDEFSVDFASIRVQYSMMETNLLSKYQTTEGREKVHTICALGLIGSEKAIPILLDHIDWSISPIYYMWVRGHRTTFSGARSVGVDYPSIMALDYQPVPLSEYLDRIEQEPNPKSLRIDLWTASGYAKHQTNFLQAVREKLPLDTNRWSYVLARANIEEYMLRENHWHFANPTHWTDPSAIQKYAMMQTNLLLLAESACSNQNFTNLLEAVSTYRFIHAPIPEAIFTNDFFQATIGEE